MIRDLMNREREFLTKLNLIRNKIKNKIQTIPYYSDKNYRAFPPQVVFLTVNDVCNLKCIMCDIGQKNLNSQFYKNLINSNKDNLSYKNFQELIDQVSIFRPHIAIVGTEPLLYKDIIELCKYIKSKKLSISLTTNGYLLEKYAEKLVEVGLDELCVSVDGLKETHDYIRGVKGTFEKVLSGIKLINKFRESLEANLPLIRLNYTISNFNYDRLCEFAQYMKTFGFDSITFSHLNFVSDEMAKRHNKIHGSICKATISSMEIVKPEEVNIDILWEEIKKVNSLDYSYKIGFIPEINSRGSLYDYYNNPSVIISNNKCLVPWVSASIDSNGDVIILARCFNIKVGNILKEPFNQIWNGEKMRDFRKELKKEGLFIGCTRCCGVL